MNDPTLLLADEPTGNLDPDLDRDHGAALPGQLRGTTVLVATHDSEMVDKHAPSGGRAARGSHRARRGVRRYRPDESTTEFAIRLRGELGVGRKYTGIEGLGFFVKEALRALRNNSAPALAACRPCCSRRSCSASSSRRPGHDGHDQRGAQPSGSEVVSTRPSRATQKEIAELGRR